jgi:hypothetical protein
MGEPLILLSDFSTTECDEIFVSIVAVPTITFDRRST